jgi:DNA-binding transcriptional MerR regulator
MKSNKSKIYLGISELSVKLDLVNKNTNKPASYILRFWEKEFKEIKPLILKGNRRYYDDKQIKIIKFIKYLLKDKGLTVNGVKKILKEKKNIDGSRKNNIEEEYLKMNIKNKSKKILKKLNDLKKHG